jgi:CCR4-NOT transcription complex subunit 1
MQKTSKENPNAFNPRPFFRMFIGLYMEILESNAADEVIMIPSLAAIADALLALQPLRIPAFAFSWLELVSHRSFMPKLLLATGQNGWPHFQKLLIALLQFLEPYLRNAELTDSIRLMYKGTLRMLLVLLHDFPEFLCKYHFQLCDVIPSSYIQMRNLMLSAFPRNMRLPDPFTPNLKVDLLPEISESPRIVVDFNSSLLGLQVPLNTYLSMRQPANFLSELPQKLLLPQAEALGAGTRYNVPLINALVLYIGMNAIHKGQAIPMEMFRELVMDLDAEGRYLLLNAIANQLRYPNSHTHYFSCVLLFLFAESSVEIVKEQITRVLLERLIVNRPHPWGLLITFIELIKNPRYQFWSHGFTHCAPEVERLFENVARSCIGQQKQEDTEKKTAIDP